MTHTANKNAKPICGASMPLATGSTYTHLVSAMKLAYDISYNSFRGALERLGVSR